MKDLFAEHHLIIQDKIKQILISHNYESLLIHSGSLVYHFLDDMAKPFKVNPHFNYLAPLTSHPDCFIYLSSTEKPTLYYYKPVDYWHEMAADPSGFWVDQFNIKIIKSAAEVFTELKKNFKTMAVISPNPEQFSSRSIKAINPSDLITEIHFIRAEKTRYEQACMKQANQLGARAHKAAELAFREGLSEYEINQAYLKSLEINQNETPYSNIVALNRNAATLHYTDYKKERFVNGNLHSFLIDAGASYNGYGSDITRTYSKENNEFAELLISFDKKQLKLIDDIKIDTAYVENHFHSHIMIAELLSEFEFVNLPTEGIIEHKITAKFYPHGVGHFLGLQVHDVGGFLRDPKGTQLSPPDDHPFLRLTRTIKNAHIFTIEPGLYFIDSLLAELKASDKSKYVNWDKVDEFRKYGGIRIEDNICMHSDHIENFTRDAFNELT